MPVTSVNYRLHWRTHGESFFLYSHFRAPCVKTAEELAAAELSSVQMVEVVDLATGKVEAFK